MANVSVKFREEGAGPLFRVKAPVKLFLVPLAVGASYTVADGTAMRVGSTLPWGLSWRLQLWPWGAIPSPLLRLVQGSRCFSQARSRPAWA